MTNIFLLDWLLLAVSISNMILQIWLGLTVLLNADRRDWGVWLAGGGLLLGGVFFVSHSAIVGVGLNQFSWGSQIFWWLIGMGSAILLPLLWYLVILWYSGFWQDRQSSFFLRQRNWLALVVILLILGIISLFLTTLSLIFPDPRFFRLLLFIRGSLFGVPLLAFGFSGYLLLCFGLALDALLRPGPSARVMGHLARQKARPWLIAVSIALFLVSVLMAGAVFWIVQSIRTRLAFEFYYDSVRRLGLIDLLISTIIAVAVILLGQGLVSYEVYTGKTLPRRGLLRHWRRAIILAVGYGVLVGGATTIQVRPMYILLMTALLMTLFYALVSWRSYAERERYMEQLRPFISSQKLYDRLLTTGLPTDAGDQGHLPFQTLCYDVLDSKQAYLVAVGSLAPLVNPPFIYPAHLTPQLPAMGKLTEQFTSPEKMIVPVEAADYAGAVWGVSLWSERGLSGILLLGEKRSNGVYSQEEIEIARMVGERLIDTRASAAIAQRLMVVQRERLAKTQIIDQQTRRILHDEILPALHTAMIELHSHDSIDEASAVLAATHKQVSDLLHDLPTTLVPEVARLGLIKALRQTVDLEFGHAFDGIVWRVTEDVETQLETISPMTAEIVYYAAREAVRNAAKYGRDGKRPFTLTLSADWQTGFQLSIFDNGTGLIQDSTQGTGQGLPLHSTLLAVVGGTLSIESAPNEYTRITIRLPDES